MPELPEVENIKLQLQKFLIGHEILDVEVRYGKKFEGKPKDLVGGKIINVRRYGKVLSIDLDNNFSVVIHIKLTGQLIYRNKKRVKSNKLSLKIIGGLGGKHTHVIFHLDKAGVLYFNDVRKFGWIRVARSRQVTSDRFVGKLGPEPVIDSKNPPENPLSYSDFERLLLKTPRAIKLLLMDQEKLSGVGNIYANDALWLAGVNPKRKSSSLQKEESKNLFDAVIKVLREGLKRGGASELSFVTPDGKEGNYQDFTLVYGREGEICKRTPCKQMGSKIEKIKLSGRGTYFCPNCQK